MLTSTEGTRVHAWGLNFDGPTMWVSRYDASGIMQSYPVHIFKEFPRFAAIIMAMSLFNREQWGVQTAVDYPVGAPVIPQTLQGSMFSFKLGDVDHTVTLGKSAFIRCGLFGRNTNVHKATCESLGEGALAIKFSQTLHSRHESEAELIQIAKDAGVSHIPDVYASRSMAPMSQGVRGKVYRSGEARLSSRKLTEGAPDAVEPMSTVPKWDDRKTSALVSKLYKPITSLEDVDELEKVFLEAVWGASGLLGPPLCHLYSLSRT